MASPEVGVATTQTKTMAAAANTWETLTFSPITPTAAGRVKIQILAKSDATNGMTYFDTFT